MTNPDFYHRLEEQIIKVLSTKKGFDENTILRTIELYRILDFNPSLLAFFANRNLLTRVLLNTIHHTIQSKKEFISKNKVLDLKLLFDFRKDKSENWDKLNFEFKKYLKTNRNVKRK